MYNRLTRSLPQSSFGLLDIATGCADVDMPGSFWGLINLD